MQNIHNSLRSEKLYLKIAAEGEARNVIFFIEVFHQFEIIVILA